MHEQARRKQTAPEPKAPRGSLRRFCCVASRPAQEWRGAPGFALRYLFKVFLRQKLSRPARAFSHGSRGIRLLDRRLGVATPATRPPEPHRSPQGYGPQVHCHRTCQDGSLHRLPAPPGPFLPEGRSPGKPVEQAREKYTGRGEGRG